MDVAQALADLTEISSQIETATLFDAEGKVLASTLAGEEAGARLVEGARGLLEAAAGIRSEEGEPTQLEAALHEGSVFVVRDGDRAVVATTRPSPTVGLVFYDLKSCLRSAAEAKPKRAPRRRRKSETDDAA
jgi:predicted regulator of Ras-like GTPase activity (Roadblock/LC7/MglB family)